MPGGDQSASGKLPEARDEFGRPSLDPLDQLLIRSVEGAPDTVRVFEGGLGTLAMPLFEPEVATVRATFGMS